MRRMVVTALGLGLLKPAPGTWGSLPPVGIALILLYTAPSTMCPVLAGLCLLSCIACIAFTPWAERHFGTHDAPQIVIDEVAGMALALVIVLGTPWSGPPAVGWIMVTFVMFRLLDILKPPPIHGLQRAPGGWGVLLDDIAAGAVAGIIVVAIQALMHM